MVRQIKDLGKAGAGGEILVPGAVRTLRFEQIFDPLMQAVASGIASGEQTGDGPCGLGRRAPGWREGSGVIAGAGFAPGSVGVLNRAQPLASSQHMRLAVVFAHRSEAAERETSAVDVSHAPAAVPASIRLLRAHQVIHAALDRRMAAVVAISAE